ncbi:DEAH-box ATP-dependent RNA helicase PRP22 [Sugiyamaella lignohabitans]|uniref:DEAH-box ATP-dependent RNA helicase PRP22 n=1 Tax=Sugiyamaella lignohabitans TaxID=796027 RepID=A0A167CU84_9ASCO|nr:DEAH-box ATP-dependent RNA helicase PRP22 [Sugiyamaella lignohabitans]ANB12112.1 DEAH-box ATP-dependent RNA helicase PRP22 [Sugiyamaella lignohabitans]
MVSRGVPPAAGALPQTPLLLLRRRICLDCGEGGGSILTEVEQVIRKSSAVSPSHVSIVVASSLSGVYTEVPQYLYQELTDGKILAVVVEDPERSANRLVSAIATESHSVTPDARLERSERSRGVWGAAPAAGGRQPTQLEAGSVGYTSLFSDFVGAQTRVKYVTAEMLLREALVDPLLRSYGIVYVEDFHERAAWTDILLGVTKKVLKVRPDDLRVVVHSVTDDVVELLRRFFSPGEDEKTRPFVVQVKEGEEKSSLVNHVDVLYSTQSYGDYVKAAVDTVTSLYSGESRRLVETATVVVFLASKGDVSRASQLLKYHSGLPQGIGIATEVETLDMKDLSQGGLIVLTCENGAETNFKMLSCGTVQFVVDCGYRGYKWFQGASDGRGNADINDTVNFPVAKSQAELRKLLASHADGPGKCFRLYTEAAAFNVLTDGYIPQIQGSSQLPEIILRLKALGIDNIARSFPFLTAPSVDVISRTLSLLWWHKIIDDYGKLTAMGEKLALLPLDIRLGRAVYLAAQTGCLSEMITIAAMVAVGGLSAVLMKSEQAMADHKQFYTVEGDYLTLLNIYALYISTRKRDGVSFINKWAKNHGIHGDVLEGARNIRSQLQTAVNRTGLRQLDTTGKSTSSAPSNPSELANTISNCITQAFFLQVAKRISHNTYELVGPHSNSSSTALPDTFCVYSDLTKPLTSPWVVYEKLTQGTDGNIYLTGVNMADRATLELTNYYKSIRR